MDKSRLEGLLRRHYKDGLGSTCADTSEEVVGSVTRCQYVLLNIGVRSESHVVLGHGEEQESTVTLVKAKEAIVSDSVLEDVDGAHGVLLLVQLHDSFSVLGWVRARDLNGTRQSTCILSKSRKT